MANSALFDLNWINFFLNAGKAYLTSDRYRQEIPNLLAVGFSSKARLDA